MYSRVAHLLNWMYQLLVLLPVIIVRCPREIATNRGRGEMLVNVRKVMLWQKDASQSQGLCGVSPCILIKLASPQASQLSIFL